MIKKSTSTNPLCKFPALENRAIRPTGIWRPALLLLDVVFLEPPDPMAFPLPAISRLSLYTVGLPPNTQQACPSPNAFLPLLLPCHSCHLFSLVPNPFLSHPKTLFFSHPYFPRLLYHEFCILLYFLFIYTNL
ncbi:hypothetical protein AMTRI_Chr13g118200 [Amborella trichopoda]